MMEACMLTGRSCIMFELDGFRLLIYSLPVKQFRGVKVRMNETMALLKKQASLSKYPFFLFFSFCFSNREFIK